MQKNSMIRSGGAWPSAAVLLLLSLFILLTIVAPFSLPPQNAKRPQTSSQIAWGIGCKTSDYKHILSGIIPAESKSENTENKLTAESPQTIGSNNSKGQIL
jgi:hypothetical protein